MTAPALKEREKATKDGGAIRNMLVTFGIMWRKVNGQQHNALYHGGKPFVLFSLRFRPSICHAERRRSGEGRGQGLSVQAEGKLPAR